MSHIFAARIGVKRQYNIALFTFFRAMINCLVLILIFHPFSCRNVTIPSVSLLFELFGYQLFATDGYVKNQECFDVAMYTVETGRDGFSVESLRTLVNKNGSYFICEFNFDFDLSNNLNLQIFSHWYCEVDNDVKCNGLFTCLTDECNCDKNTAEVFYCTDNVGCVPFDKLCDDRQHCRDGSDEWFCGGKTINTYNLSSVENPLVECINDAYESYIVYIVDPPTEVVSSYCKSNCSHVANLTRFCDFLYLGSQSSNPLYIWNAFVFNCEKNMTFDISVDVPHNSFCDGNVDCPNSADEIGCPGRYYCSPNISAEWIGYDKVCDNVKDCSNGQDECEECDFGFQSSSKFLIHSNLIFALTIAVSLSTILMNIIIGYKCLSNTASTNTGKIDKINRLQVFFFDGLMGIYMCSIIIASIFLGIKGDYCKLQHIWRSSYYCSMLGILFSISSHGSVIAITSMSVMRCLVCYRYEYVITKTRLIVGSAILFTLNFFHAALPVLPIVKIKDMFRTDLFFTNLEENPFFNTNPIDISNVLEMHQKAFSKKENIYIALEELQNLTSGDGLFDFLEISYYGNTDLCIHNIFSSKESYAYYKIVYCSVMSIMLAVLTASYFMIIRYDRKTKAELKINNNRHTDNNATSSSLMIKVGFMIITQLVSWTSLMSATVYFQYIAKTTAPQELFEWFGLVIIPANSLINPIFYSDLYKILVTFFWQKWRDLIHKIS